MASRSRVGASLASLRRSAGLSRLEVAAAVGTSERTLQAIEEGALLPSPSLAAAIAAAIAARLAE